MSDKALQQYLEYLQISGIDDVFLKSSQAIEAELKKKKESKHSILEQYRKQYCNCTRCELSKGRINLVYGNGNADARLMLIGEGPGAEENKTGKVFVGRAGQLLTKMLKAIELERDDVYIANIVKCRPPGNRNPLESERQACFPYLLEQIELIQPQIILLLGKVAGNTILKNKMTLGAMRKGIYQFMGITTYVTYHPAALLRDHSPEKKYKRLAWEDLKRVKANYNRLGSK